MKIIIYNNSNLNNCEALKRVSEVIKKDYLSKYKTQYSCSVTFIDCYVDHSKTATGSEVFTICNRQI